MVQPGATFMATASGATPGLVGTVGVRILRQNGTTVAARTTVGIIELLAESGSYTATLTAPSAPGTYAVVWDDGTVSPSTISVEELIVTASPVLTGEAVGSGTAVAELVDVVSKEGVFDASPATILRWLDRRHLSFCARTKCFRRKLDIGPTAAGVSSYALPAEVQEIRELLVGAVNAPALGVPYGVGLERDLAQGALGYLWLGGLYQAVGGGIFTRDESGAGADLVALYPTPTEAGQPIVIRAVCRPPHLVDGGRVVTPPEFDDALVAGAIATGLERLEARPDLASAAEARFSQACGELLGEVERRYRGSGPAEIRVAGYTA